MMGGARRFMVASGVIGLSIGGAFLFPVVFEIDQSRAEAYFYLLMFVGLPAAGIGTLLLLVAAVLWVFGAEPRAGSAKNGVSREQQQLRDSKEFLAGRQAAKKVIHK